MASKRILIGFRNSIERSVMYLRRLYVVILMDSSNGRLPKLGCSYGKCSLMSVD